MKRIAITIVVFLSGLGIAKADPGDTVVLYQPDAVIGQRLGGDAESLASFILKCQDCWAQVTTNAVTRSRTALIVAFGMGRQSAGWIVGLANTNSDEVISRKLVTLQTPHLTEGFVAFAVLGKNYEQELKKQKEFAPPLPNQWKQVSEKRKKPTSTDDILDLILPKKTETKATVDMSDKPSFHNRITGKATPPEEAPFTVPEGYLLQILEPSGGKIARPKDWFYAEQHHGPVYSWTISREDTKKGPYETGFRIQTFALTSHRLSFSQKTSPIS